MADTCSTSRDPYCLTYDSLPSMDCIRLLQKCGTTADGLLSFSLRTASLDDEALSYCCLSYTWGNPFAHGRYFREHFESVSAQYQASNQVPVLVNGNLLHIQKNLHDALIAVGDTALTNELNQQSLIGETGRRIWADAICINQDDVEEKSVQVSMMDKIYSRACAVLAWLGPSDSHTELGLKALSTLAAHLQKFQESQIEPYGGTKDKYKEAGVPFISREEWIGLASIFQRQWFRRAWIVQEAILPSVLLMHIGNTSLSWSSLGSVSEVLRLNEAKLGTARSRDFVPETDVAVSVEWNMAEMYKWRNNMSLARCSTLEKALSYRKLFVMDHLLPCFWTFLASDARDKIYALYGLLNAFSNDKARADYRRPLAGVFTSATRRIIVETGSLEVLANCIYSEKRHNELPGWVPDFSLAGINPIPDIFAADKGLKFQLTTKGSEHSPILRTQGMYVGKITKAGGRVDTRPFGMLRFDPSWLKLVLSLRKTPDAEKPKRVLSEVLWRTLCMNMSHGSLYDSTKFGPRAPDEYGKQFTAMMLLFITAGADEVVLNEIGKMPAEDDITICTIPFNPFEGEMASVLDDLDALAEHDGDQCCTPYRDEVLSLYDDLKFTLVRITGGGDNGWPEDFYVPQDVMEGHSRCVGRGYVKTNSRLFRRCQGIGRAFSLVYGGRQLVTIDNEYMGMAPLLAQAGDEVWIFPGLKSPAVLKAATGLSDSSGANNFSTHAAATRRRFLGACYVHGLMDGEAVSKSGFSLVDIELE